MMQCTPRALSHFASESMFHKAADEAFNYMSENLSLMEDEHELEMNMSQGVLKLETPSAGTWVLNKQGPNQQIWWSSPLSGPLRFDFDDSSGEWVSSRTKAVSLIPLLQAELSETLGVPVKWKRA